MKIYKYFSGNMFSLVFARTGFCSVKCSFPKDYNDPFELFLGVDLSVPTHLLATYRETIDQVPQFPTTCFSIAPTVAPMWAHYANNHTGFVVEYDIERLKEELDETTIRAVSYKDTPNPDIGYMLARSAMTMKPRHVVWLQQAVLSEAYFSKQTAWSYEQECRMVVPQSEIELINGFMILPIPLSCVTSIIVGSRADRKLKEESISFSKENKIDWLQEIIGTSNSLPFFRSENGETLVFVDGALKEASRTCSDCKEPIFDDGKKCAWCRITEADEIIAARSNPFRALDHAGILDDYLASVSEIERRSRK